MTTKDEAFMDGFLARCSEEGLNAAQVEQRLADAAEFLKRAYVGALHPQLKCAGVGGALVSDVTRAPGVLMDLAKGTCFGSVIRQTVMMNSCRST